MKPLILAVTVVGLVLPALAAPRPNIILAMADDMGWGDPGYNSMTVTYADGTPHPDQGWISTPTMDAMAANGLRFDRFYSASAVCSPTRASCLTGRNPYRVGVPDANTGRLGFDETPLSEVLTGEGYQCGHFGKWHLGSMTTLRPDSNRGGNTGVYSAPWHHSYDFCFATESKVPTYHPYRKANNSLALPTSFTDSNFYGTRYWRMPATWNQTSGEGEVVPVNEVNNATNGDDSKLIVDQAIPFIQDAVSQGKPFFVVLWFHTPHKPAVDPQGTSGIDSSDAGRDSIQDLDTALGRVRAELDTLGVRGNTMFWLTSDNGPEDGINSFGETSTVRSIRSGRLLERKRSLHEGGVRVPGILEWPDVITTGTATGFPAITSDYYPTILDYLCLSVPGQNPLDGISLRPVIEGTATTRSKPIGFKYSGDNSWMNHQYKLINDGSGWELYDLLNIAPGEEVEQTALATAANVGSQPQAVQDVYNDMLAEYTAWNATLSSDTSYVHPSQPTVTLSAPTGPFSGPFTVTATFSEAVTQLHANEFAVTNGTASNLAGGGTTWTITITPDTNGAVTVALPEGSVIDPDGNPNAASNQLNVNTPPSVVTPFSLDEFQTVDVNGLFPANGSNNIDKFDVAGSSSATVAPFDTTAYVRSSTSTTAANLPRRVQLYLQFDLAGLTADAITNATLEFDAYSLNDITANDNTLFVSQLANDWAPAGTPDPVFNPAVVGTPIDAGGVVSGTDSDLYDGGFGTTYRNTTSYAIDVTSIVQAWQGGAANHGFHLELGTSSDKNQGIGIDQSSLALQVEQEQSGPPPGSSLLDMSNGEMNVAVPTLPNTGDGADPWSFDPATNEVLYNGAASAAGPNQWVLPSLTRGFTFNADGGAGGAGDGAMVDNPATAFNQKPRAVFYVADDNKQSTGPLDFGLDVFLDDNTAANALQFLVEIHAWNDGQTAPQLSAGGGTANDPTYNLTSPGDAVTILDRQIPATSVADATWETVPFGSVDVGTGYDNYIWRIGVLGATPGDTFAFDNVTVTAATVAGIKLTSVTRAPNGDVTLLFTSTAGNVDIYRSTGLESWGTPIAPNVAPPSFLDDTAATLAEAFYILVPTGVPYP